MHFQVTVLMLLLARYLENHSSVTLCFALNCVSLEIRDLFSYIDTVEMVMDLYLACYIKKVLTH